MIGYLTLGSFVLLAGIGTLIAGYQKPAWFWPLLLMAAIVGIGPSLFGIVLFDEYLLACLLAGAILVVVRKNLPVNWIALRSLHLWVFLLFSAYLVFQSLRGMVVQQDWRLLRYAIYFSMLGVLAVLLAFKDFSPPSGKRFAVWVLWATNVYLLLYIVVGIIGYLQWGEGGQFLTQGQHWSGSAYAVFPIIAGAPAAALLIRKNPLMVALFVILGMVTAFFFNSRTALLALIFFFLVWLDLRRLLWLGVGGCLTILCLFLWYPDLFNQIVALFWAYVDGLSETLTFLWDPRESDRDRNLQFLAGLRTLWDNEATLLFGNGFYSHKTALLPSLRALNAPVSFSGIVRPIGMPALLVDVGLLGFLLYAANLFLCMLRTLKTGIPVFAPQTRVLAISFLLTVFWLFISNVQDAVLFFLMFMPLGVIEQLGKVQQSNVHDLPAGVAHG